MHIKRVKAVKGHMTTKYLQEVGHYFDPSIITALHLPRQQESIPIGCVPLD